MKKCTHFYNNFVGFSVKPGRLVFDESDQRAPSVEVGRQGPKQSSEKDAVAARLEYSIRLKTWNDMMDKVKPVAKQNDAVQKLVDKYRKITDELPKDISSLDAAAHKQNVARIKQVIKDFSREYWPTLQGKPVPGPAAPDIGDMPADWLQAPVSLAKKTDGKVVPDQVDEGQKNRLEQFQAPFEHAVGRAFEHDRDDVRTEPFKLLKTDPAGFEKAVTKMINGITERDLKEIKTNDNWQISYQGLTFAVSKGDKGLSARLIDADRNTYDKGTYGKLAQFLDARKPNARTAMVEGRKITTGI